MPMGARNVGPGTGGGTAILAALLACIAIGTSTPAMAAFKKWRISKSDESRYSSAFVAFNRSIFSEICRKDGAGRFSEPQFSNVNIPNALRERFAESALERYFNRVDRDRVRGWMKGLTADGNWTWDVTVRKDVRHSHRSELGGVPFITVNIHNRAPLGFHGVTLHIPALKRSYTMLSGLPLSPRNKGSFKLQLSEQDYALISGGRHHASIRHIWW